MGKSVGSSQISNYTFVVVSLLVGFFICNCCFFRLIDFDQRISVDFEVFKCGHCLNDLVITFSIPLSAFQVLQVDIC